MALIPGICTQCKATLSVDKDKDAMTCPYCGTAFIVEKAINHFNTMYNITNNINAQNVYVQSEQSDFEIVGGVLRKYTGSAVDVVVPNTVLSIGPQAFSNTMIRSIKLPNSVLEIEWNAFSRCKSLKNIDWSENLKSIGACAFEYCESLASISLPNSVKCIAPYAFSYCTNLQTIYLSRKLLQSESYDPTAFTDTSEHIRTTCPKLQNIYVDKEKLTINDPLINTHFQYTQLAIDARNTKTEWRNNGLCQFCGGSFKGIAFRKCSVCNRTKDY